MYTYTYLIKYSSGEEIKKNEMCGHVARVVKRTRAYRILVGKPETKKTLGKSRRRLEDNIEIELQEIG
jgi:hypothetical protein